MLRLDDPAVSRLHAEIELRTDGQFWIRDLGSTNGTWLDGVFVREARLAPGSKLRLGATTLTFEYAAGSSKTPLWPAERLGPLVARSESMRSLFYVLAEYARTDSPVLVQGETGTGKELVARAIHEASNRASGPFVVVDCGALPETLLESELFGHVKGSFTGATTTRAGAFETADGGTVFIDEIGELPLSMQPKLLRVLESQTVRRVGESNHRRVNVRFVAATHRDLRAMVAAGSFREDVYFRLAVLPVFVPPLRERPDDIGLLLDHFLASRHIQVPPEVVREMERCPWPGNVRELRSFTERAAAIGPVRAWEMTQGLRTSSNSLPVPAERESSPHSRALEDSLAIDPTVPFKVLREARNDHFEREYLKALIARHGRDDVGVLADAAGLDRSYVHRLLRRHEL
jgi:transcriptional regulator with GAF, ATPase, and Fis domain